MKFFNDKRIPHLILLVIVFASLFLAGFTTNNQPSHDSHPLSQILHSSHAPQSDEAEEDTNVTLIIEVVIGLLLISSLVGIVTERLRIPYTAGLVLIGLILALVGQQDINVSPELFLGLLVPPLIFEAAFQVKSSELIDDLAPILSLAIPGVLLTTFLVGGVLYWGTDFSLITALLFGSLIAATDPVSVTALFRSLGVPKRLQLLLEGESLFNDGTAIVVFNLMLTIAVTGYFNLGESILDFFVVSGGGFIVGFVLGLLISLFISIIDNALIETTLTSVLAFGSYIVAEQFHVSGVLAVVAAGLVSGNLGPSRMAPTTKILVFNFWEYAAFLANSIIFLLIGLQINLNIILTDWIAILWAIIAVLVARAAAIYGLSWIGSGVPMRYKHVLYWGGLRGAISLALVLSLPASLGPQLEIIRSMAFGVVLFTLLVQGLTMKPLIARMDLIERSEAQKEFESLNARAVMAKSAHDHLETLYNDGLLSSHVWSYVSQPIAEHASALVDAAATSLTNHPDVEARELESAVEEVLKSEKSALLTLLRDGIISEEIFSQLMSEVDAAITESHTEQISFLRNRTRVDIEVLMTIVIQERDIEKISALLEPFGFPITHIASTGGFLGRKNATILVGVPIGKQEEIKHLIEDSSIKKAKIHQDMDSIIPEKFHDGATIFTLDVERYEVL